MAKGKDATVRRKRRDAASLREAIVTAAAEEFEANGYAGATTAAIARRADVTEAQIFRIFDTKAELFRTAVFEPLNRHFSDFHARQLAATSDATPMRDQARAYITELQAFIESHSRMLMTLVVSQAYVRERDGAASPAGIEAMIAGLRPYFERGAAMMRSRMGDFAVSPELMVRVSFAAVLGNVLFKEWMIPGDVADDAAVRDATIAFVLDGINANDDPGLRRG
ncbi:MAG: TetR family transcriptional regulator [Sphingomonadales bacterium]|nr:TetR family transcriptional regulator [Sphingomonadales bacterium]